jgi:hypothetical protein
MCAFRIHYWRLGRTFFEVVCLLGPGMTLALSLFSLGVNGRVASVVGGVLGLIVGGFLIAQFESKPPFELEVKNERIRLKFPIDEVGRDFERANPKRSPVEDEPNEPPILAPLPKELLGPKMLREKESGRLIGRLTAGEFEFLAARLERESDSDRDFFIDGPTIDMLTSDGAPASLISLLRNAVSDSDGIDVVWSS